MKAQWCIYNIALPNAVLVTLIYWLVLYPQLQAIGFETSFIDISLHGLNTVFMLIEQYLGAIPSRILHVYQPMLYGVVYVLFFTILWAINGDAEIIYRYILDWTHPGYTVASICGILLFFIATQLGLFVVYRLQQKHCENQNA